jgi:hypothetical protein
MKVFPAGQADNKGNRRFVDMDVTREHTIVPYLVLQRVYFEV